MVPKSHMFSVFVLIKKYFQIEIRKIPFVTQDKKLRTKTNRVEIFLVKIVAASAKNGTYKAHEIYKRECQCNANW